MKVCSLIYSILMSLSCVLCLAQSITATYTTHTNQIANPERGFYRYTETRASSLNPLTTNQLNQIRQQDLYTVVFRYVYLDAFMNSNISNVFLTSIQNDFNAMRSAGFKVVLRFAYTSTWNGTSTGPFLDSPSKAQLLQHIQQLKPLVQQNSDVILTLQNGFWGIWGENYYSDVFGCECNGTLTPARWLDRKQVTDSLLAMLPANRFLSARYPTLKSTMYNLNIPGDSITLAQSHTIATKSRIGYHNDCFLVANNDYTFNNTAVEKPFWEKESRYTIMGGETCGDNATYANCTNALLDLTNAHWTYLNYDFHPDVITRWQNSGCLNEITQRLGYRLSLNQASTSSSACRGTNLPLSLSITNSGFAAPVHERSVILVLRSASNTYTFPLTIDPRTWYGGTTKSINVQVPIPASVVPDTYALLLHLPDASPTLSANSRYAIQLANTGLWEAATGYHNLNLSITVPDATICGSLPVEFIRFDASHRETKVDLSWQVFMKEVNRFTIERALDAIHFEPIGHLEWNQNVEHMAFSEHHFTDEYAPKGKCYYRISAHDEDGSLTYSAIKSVDQIDKSTLSVIPNPGRGLFTVSGKVTKNYRGPQVISVINSIGQQVFNAPFFSEDFSFSTTIDLSHLTAGMYIIKVGNEQLHTKVVIE
jgi:hypothetical protein